MPVSGFATPAAAPGDLAEGELWLVAEDSDSDSVLEPDVFVAVSVDAALSLLSLLLESSVELETSVGAGPASREFVSESVRLRPMQGKLEYLHDGHAFTRVQVAHAPVAVNCRYSYRSSSGSE